MNKRERYGIMLAAGVIAIFIFAVFIVEPFFSRSANMKNSLQTKADMLVEMQRLQSEYTALTQQAKISKSRFQRRPKGIYVVFLSEQTGRRVRNQRSPHPYETNQNGSKKQPL